MELLVAADGDQDEQILQDDNGAEDHNDDVEGGELPFILNVSFQILVGHVLCKGIVGLDQRPIVVLGILALHGDGVTEHSGFTAKIHSHSGSVLFKQQLSSLPERTGGGPRLGRRLPVPQSRQRGFVGHLQTHRKGEESQRYLLNRENKQTKQTFFAKQHAH